MKSVADAGHEVYPHGWSHIQWQRNVHHIDIRQHLELCIEQHKQIFNVTPIGFASPSRVYNEVALKLFDEYGFLFIGDMDGNKPFQYENYKVMQIPVTLFKTIAELVADGLSQDEIADRYFSHIIENEFSNIYEHPDNLHRFELGVLDKLLSKLIASGVKFNTFSEVHQYYS